MAKNAGFDVGEDAKINSESIGHLPARSRPMLIRILHDPEGVGQLCPHDAGVVLYKLVDPLAWKGPIRSVLQPSTREKRWQRYS